MNSKILIVVVAVLVLIGAIVLLSNKPVTVPTQQTSVVTGQKPPTTLQTSTITVTKTGFTPKTLTVKTGTRVVWLNQDAGLVSINSAVHPTHKVYPPLNLGSFGNGSSVQLEFKTPGTYSYHNHFNPSQTGTVEVTQ